eukprot:scaffold234057_cov39-Prasinocladus_malaysianus.AAC.1
MAGNFSLAVKRNSGMISLIPTSTAFRPKYPADGGRGRHRGPAAQRGRPARCIADGPLQPVRHVPEGVQVAGRAH